MTTETDCPSHTEARERLASRLADHHHPTITIGTADLRTLLATPTQEGVGREEIEAIVRQIVRQTVWLIEHNKPVDGNVEDFTDEILSLFSPTERADPGAGEETAWLLEDPTWDGRSGYPVYLHRAHYPARWMAQAERPQGRQTEPFATRNVNEAMRFPTKEAAEAYQKEHRYLGLWAAREHMWIDTPSPASTSSGEPAPGAPEGWREALVALRAALEKANSDGIITDTIWVGDAPLFDFIDLALTSSSAKPAETETKHAANIKAELAMLAQSNRRLREGLTQAYADIAIVQAALDGGAAGNDVSLHSTLDELRPLIADTANDAALKDNGHG